MCRVQLLLVISLLALTECRKEPFLSGSLFTFRGDTISNFLMATYDTCSLFPEREQAESFLWDFGDGRFSKENRVVLSYDKSGTYTVKLRITNKRGRVTECSKSVSIMDRVLKEITIIVLSWETNGQNGWPATTKADVYAQFQYFTDTAITQPGIYPNCPVICKSSVFKDVSNRSLRIIEIPVYDKIIINRNLVRPALYTELGKSYLFSLMGNDSNGKTYRLHNNLGSGCKFRIDYEDFKSNTSVLICQVPYTFYCEMLCTFE